MWAEVDSHEPIDLSESPVGTLSPTPRETPSRRQTRQPKSWNVLAFFAAALGLTASPLSLVFGLVSLRHIRLSDQRGESLAWAAISLGWLWLWAWTVALVSLAMIWRERGFTLEQFAGVF